MKAHVIFEDKGARSVLMTTDLENVEDGPPAASGVLTLATRILFENGMLARMGQIALQAVSEGKSPSDAIMEKYKESRANDTQERRTDRA